MTGSTPRKAVLALSARLVRRGALFLTAAGGGYVALEVVSYLNIYPDQASRARLATFQENPAIRMTQGLAHNVDTVGGYVAWDAGWFLQSLVALWALLAVLRLTRGDEEGNRSVLVLMAPLRARQVLSLQLLVVTAVVLLFSATCSGVLMAYGVPPAGAVAFGLGLAGFGATFAGVAAVNAQLFEVRRQAAGASAVVLVGTFFVRMIGNSSEPRGWLRWLSPYGWMDDLRPYDEPRWVALALLVLTPVALVGLASVLRDRRDTGGATLASNDSRTPRTRLLGSPVAFAWRGTRGVLAAWAVGLGAYALLVGSLLPALTDYLLDESSVRKTMTTLGIDLSDITGGMVAFMSTMFGLGISLYACWRIGAVRAEEESGRADLLLARPLSRRRWLGGHLALSGSSVLVLAAVTGLCLWAGGRASGAKLSLWDALRASTNTAPVALLFLALAVLLLGVRPRLAVPLSASAAGVSYLLPTLGRALSLPVWVRDLSPFQHLALVPMQPYALTSGLVMLGLASVLAAVASVAFSHRDLTGP